MAVLKCSVCGGELELNSDLSVGTCLFCNSVITIPKELDRKGHLYNRAVFLRQSNEFDKAELVYEDLLKEDNEDADAHWGLILSKFGIEYVKDPTSGEYLPTCHRTQTEPILSDPDYLAAIKYADTESRRVIETEAKKIASIQKRVLEISAKEPPYDVFICYKESDANGNRTKDSILAQELYFELCKRGYRVFFARKTLESKLGTEYEPIIFAALNSASVMVVLGTCAEHFNAVWVKNEWSRFLKMSRKKSGQKMIIPAYRDVSPYELPNELSVFQSQDMAKIGFMQDLTDGIDRVLHKGNTVTPNPRDIDVKNEIEDDLKRAATFMRLKNYGAALQVYKDLTADYPEDYRGWWGVFVCKTENLTQPINDEDDDIEETILQYVKTLATEEEYKECEVAYAEWLKNVLVPIYVENEKTDLNKKIAKLDAAITPYRDGVNVYRLRGVDKTQKHEQFVADRERQLDSTQKLLARLENEKEETEGTKTTKGFICGIAIFFMVIGLLGACLLTYACWASSFELPFVVLFAASLVLAGISGLVMKATDTTDLQKKIAELEIQIQKAKSQINAFRHEIAEAQSQYDVAIKSNADSFRFLLTCFGDIYEQRKDIQQYVALDINKRRSWWTRILFTNHGIDYRDAADAVIEQSFEAKERAICDAKTWVSFHCKNCQSWMNQKLSLFSLDMNQVLTCNCGEKNPIRGFLNADGTPRLDYIRSQEPYASYTLAYASGSAYACGEDKLYAEYKKTVAENDDSAALQDAENFEMPIEFDDDTYEDDEAQTAFDVVLIDAGEYKLNVIRAISSITGDGLADAKELVEEAPQIIVSNLSEEEAESIANGLRALGATVEVE